MDPFELPETLPGDAASLDALAEQARAEVQGIRARHDAGETLTADDADRLRYLLAAVQTVTDARAAIDAVAADVADLLREADAVELPPADPQPETPPSTAVDPPAPAAAPVAVAASTAPVSFAHTAPADVPAPAESERTGWELLPSAPGYRPGMGKVGFAEIAKAICTVKSGGMTGQQRTGTRGSMATQSFAVYARPGAGTATTPAEFLEKLEAASAHIPGHGKTTAQALTAAGGWCAPSEISYDFLPTIATADVISVVEAPQWPRGGIMFPNEPDLSAILTEEGFGWHYTEPELEATQGGRPTARKEFLDIGCPDFSELRYEAIGYAVRAGILQQQAYPESIAKHLEEFAQYHIKLLSVRTVGKIAAGATKVSLDGGGLIGVTSAILNGLALRAAVERQKRGYPANHPFEAKLPTWVREAIRADLAMMGGDDGAWSISDDQINALFTSRNIAPQFIAYWQQLPDNAVAWPETVDALLYPAGNWFRSMADVITMGTMYPIEQLQVNEYTALFTEDAFQVGTRKPGQTQLVTIPLCVSGAVGARQTVGCNTPAPATP